MACGVRAKKLPSGKYQAFFTDWKGKKRFFTASKNKAESRRIAARLEEDHRKIRQGEKPNPDILKRQQSRAIQECITTGRFCIC